MADFSLAQIGETSGGMPSPQQGVRPVPDFTVQDTGAAEAAALGFVESVGTSVFGALNEQKKKEQQLEVNKAVTSFSEQQMRIADAVDRGDISSQEARMQMRYNLIRAGADNPNLASEFTKVHETVIGTAGMGKVAAEGTEQEQAFYKAFNAASQDGFVMPGMTDEEARVATMAWQDFQREGEILSRNTAEVAYDSAKVGLATAKIRQESAFLDLDKKRQAARARQAIASGADAYSVRFNVQLRNIRNLAENGELGPVEAVQMLDEEWNRIESTLSEVGRAGDATYLSNVLAPMRKTYEMQRGYLTGETSAEILDNQVELNMAVQQAMAMSDPEVSSVLALSDMVGESNVAMIAPLNNVAQRMLEQNSNPQGRPADVTDPATSGSTIPYFNLTTNAMNKSNNDELVNGENTDREIQNNLNKILRSVGTHGAQAENPTELNSVVDFLASDTYGKYIEKNGTGIRAENAESARTVVQEQFDMVVRPLIAEEWRNASELTMAVPDPTQPETAGQTTARSSIFRPMFTGNGIEFVYTNDADRNSTRDATLRNLNNRVKPVVNRLIRVGAHLRGGRDYKGVYESNYAELFGNPGTGSAQE